MAHQYIATDIVIDRQINKILAHLMSLATSHKCELRIAQDETALETKEGYEKLRFVVKVSSKQEAENFISVVMQHLPLDKWFIISEKCFEESLILVNNMNTLPFSFNSWIDAFPNAANANYRLSQKLQSQQPVCFSYDWALPTSFSECRKWLDVVITTSDTMGIGCSIRRSQIKKGKDERYVQVLLLRLFSEDAIESFVLRAKKLMKVDDWNRVDVRDFLNAQPLYLDRLNDFMAYLESEINWNPRAD